MEGNKAELFPMKQHATAAVASLIGSMACFGEGGSDIVLLDNCNLAAVGCHQQPTSFNTPSPSYLNDNHERMNVKEIKIFLNCN